MRNLILIAVLLALVGCVESSKPVSYEQVLIKVVFLDGNVDTLTISANHEISYNGNRLIEYVNQTASGRVRAYRVKYTDRIKVLDNTNKNQ